MRSIHPDFGRPGALARSFAVAVLLSVAVVAGASGAAHAEDTPADVAAPTDGSCVGDECDGGAWRAARGQSNENSYWGMDPGHNCTNYVAWRLIQDGVERPATGPGNASDWAVKARSDGYLVNGNPVAGAVAQWDAFTSGYGAAGHVAYIERVNDDGTILVSEDYWLGGSQSASLTYRIADLSTVSNVIHYIDATSWLRRADASGGNWRVSGMGLNPNAAAMSAIRLRADGAVRVFMNEGNTLRVVTETPEGWAASNTGMDIGGGVIAAVDMQRPWPYVITADGEELVMLVGTAPGWQRMSTGIPSTGDFDAVDLGGLLPTAYVSDGGSLYEVWNDLSGWHKSPTGTPISGPVSAVVGATGWPEVYSVEAGVLWRSWADELGWHRASTGIAATGAFSAARVGDAIQVMLVRDGAMLQVTRDATGLWSEKATGIVPGTVFTTLDAAEGSPQVVQLGDAAANPVVNQ